MATAINRAIYHHRAFLSFYLSSYLSIHFYFYPFIYPAIYPFVYTFILLIYSVTNFHKRRFQLAHLVHVIGYSIFRPFFAVRSPTMKSGITHSQSRDLLKIEFLKM